MAVTKAICPIRQRTRFSGRTYPVFFAKLEDGADDRTRTCDMELMSLLCDQRNYTRINGAPLGIKPSRCPNKRLDGVSKPPGQNGGNSGSRTRNLLIKSQLLYQLSYIPKNDPRHAINVAEV